jgi:hypothetical protein
MRFAMQERKLKLCCVPTAQLVQRALPDEDLGGHSLNPSPTSCDNDTTKALAHNQSTQTARGKDYRATFPPSGSRISHISLNEKPTQASNH